jgi:hypothetical protein
MAIVLDATSKGSATSTSPLQWNHTCTGSNLVLIVGVNVCVSVPNSNADCSSVTYNGVNLTLLGSKRSNGIVQASLWYLLNPATGSNAISIDFSGTDARSDAGAVSWTGVAQSSQPDAVAGNTGSSTNPSLTVTTVADNCWVIGVECSAGTPTVTAGLTSRQSLSTGNTILSRGNLQDTNGVKTPAGDQTVNWTVALSGWGAQAASFAPYTSGGSSNLVVNYEGGVASGLEVTQI